ncbi:MAG: ABC transporter ATP-binding protein [bacterium]
MFYLSVESISKKFGDLAAVDHITFSIRKGEFISLLGPSGCGKTTTLRMIAGFELPDEGKIFLNGIDITFLPPNKRNIGMVFQSYALFPNLTAYDNIAYGLKVRRMPSKIIKERVETLLELIKLTGVKNHYPYQLSGGQQQRVALARALAIEPDVLLLDEPLSALDAKIRVALREEIRELQRKLKITTVYVTHDQEEALSMSDFVIVMNRGKIEQIGTPLEIYNTPVTGFVANFVGQLNLIKGKVIDYNEGIIELNNAKIKVAVSHLLAENRELDFMFRPENIRILSYGEKEINTFEGKVTKVIFAGSIIKLLVEWNSYNLYIDIFNQRTVDIPREGEKINFSIPPEALVPLR